MDVASSFPVVRLPVKAPDLVFIESEVGFKLLENSPLVSCEDEAPNNIREVLLVAVVLS